MKSLPNILKFFEQKEKIKEYDFPLDFTEDLPKPHKDENMPLFPNFDEEMKMDEGAEEGTEEEKETPSPIIDEVEENKIKQNNILSEAEKKAADIIAEAHQKAEEICADAKKEAEEKKLLAAEEGKKIGLEDGYQQGYQEGLEAARKEMEEKSIAFLDDLESIMDSVEKKKEETLQQYKEDLKNIAIAVGEKVIHISLKASGEVIMKMILSATEKLDRRQWAKIYLCKTDADMMVRGDIDIIKFLSHLSDQVKVIVMENESPGTCIIELPDKIIDASADTQVENIKGILNNAGL